MWLTKGMLIEESKDVEVFVHHVRRITVGHSGKLGQEKTID